MFWFWNSLKCKGKHFCLFPREIFYVYRTFLKSFVLIRLIVFLNSYASLTSSTLCNWIFISYFKIFIIMSFPLPLVWEWNNFITLWSSLSFNMIWFLCFEFCLVKQNQSCLPPKLKFWTASLKILDKFWTTYVAIAVTRLYWN